MNEFMEQAIKEAQNGIQDREGGPFGCVIVKDGKIVGRGHNEVVKRKDPTCHGEIMAIHDACAALDTFDLSGCELYTTGEPCPMCWGAILWANIDHVYYGCNIQDTEEIGFRDQKMYNQSDADKKRLKSELDRDACLKLYQDYLNQNGKIAY